MAMTAMMTSAQASVSMATMMTEAQFQQKVTDLCDWLGLKWHHETDSRKSKKGFPDLVIAGPGGVLFAELKSQKGRVSAAQRGWLSTLGDAGANCYLWRPSDWPDVEARLRQLAGRF